MRFDPAQLDTVVVKIGTSLLSGQRAFEGQVMEAVVRELCALKHAHSLDLIIVTSGAVGCGMNVLGLRERPATLREKQAVAAVGQAHLMHYYETLFRTHGNGLHAAQVLLTAQDLDDRQSYLNVRNTLQTLLEMKRIVPVINENDSTAVEELRFGDNDTLAARIAAKSGASLLIILTDVDGLYDANPRTHPDARLLTEVHGISPEIEAAAGGAGTLTGTGGMITKLQAARIGMAAGVHVVIANGHTRNIIHGVLDGSAPCTVFRAGAEAISHRKRWIAFGRASHGVITVDDGAAKALTELGKSLLPAGILSVTGEFVAGDAVTIRSTAGRDLARALVNYDSTDLRKIAGRRSTDIPAILGRKDVDEVAHRDNMALL